MPTQELFLYLYAMSLNNKKRGKDYLSTPIRVAVLIDGGYFIKRFNHLYNKHREIPPKDVVDYMYTMAHSHVGGNNYLYRIFYYDCEPFSKKMHNPISKRSIDFSKTSEALFRNEVFLHLKKKRKLALRIGYLQENGWSIQKRTTKKLFKKGIEACDIEENDVFLQLTQKSIDMKIGVDIASLALKKQVDRIVLVSGDSDFVPAAKLARREGIDFILNPMGNRIQDSLFEHIDGLESKRINIK